MLKLPCKWINLTKSRLKQILLYTRCSTFYHCWVALYTYIYICIRFKCVYLHYVRKKKENMGIISCSFRHYRKCNSLRVVLNVTGSYLGIFYSKRFFILKRQITNNDFLSMSVQSFFSLHYISYTKYHISSLLMAYSVPPLVPLFQEAPYTNILPI